MQRDDYIAVMMRYFQGVMDEDLGAIRSAFTADARVMILHGDNPRRQFHLVPRAGEESLDDFYGHIWRTFHVHFGQFTWVVDRDSQVCSAIFVPTLTPKPGSSQAAGGVLSLRNCNFFWFRDGLIYDTIIYYANPELGERLGVTTGPTTVPPRR